MATEGFKRKLTTLFSADVAGYSRLMGQDEAATVETITIYRKVMSVHIKNKADTELLFKALCKAGLRPHRKVCLSQVRLADVQVNMVPHILDKTD